MFWLILLAILVATAGAWAVHTVRKTYPEEHEFRLYERSINEY